MDFDLFSLFQISLDNYYEIRFRLWEEFGMSPNIIEKMPYFEFYDLIERMNDKIESINKERLNGDLTEIFSFSNNK